MYHKKTACVLVHRVNSDSSKILEQIRQQMMNIVCSLGGRI